MEWNRAKTILIVALFFANIALVALFLNKQAGEEKKLIEEKNFIQEVKAMIENNGIGIETEIPTQTFPIRGVIVQYENYDAEALAKKCFEDYVLRDRGEYIVYESQAQTLSVKKGKEIYYERNGRGQAKKITKEQASERALKFLNQLELSEKDIKLTRYEEQEKGTALYYSKVYDGYLLERCEMYFFIDDEGVKEFRRYWLVPMKDVAGKAKMKTAARALLNLLQNDSLVGQTIVDISPAFYYDPNVLSDAGIENTKKAQAIFSWRIQTKEGNVYFINEY